jgi:hypothetical protein
MHHIFTLNSLVLTRLSTLLLLRSKVHLFGPLESISYALFARLFLTTLLESFVSALFAKKQGVGGGDIVLG